MKCLLLFTSFLFTLQVGFTQVAVTNDGSLPNSSAMLDVKSTNKGLLIPRVSLTSLNDAVTITNPATSLLIYNTNDAVNGGAGFYYNAGTEVSPTWVKILTGLAAGWSLTGNAGSDPAINFIGTTDLKPLRFRVANLASGFIDIATRSTFFGAEAGANHTFATNTQSTGFGYQVMSVHSGSMNTAVGAYSMANNQQFGSRNSALGYETLFSNTTGQRNVAVGNVTLRSNTVGGLNIAIGDSTMFSNTSGSNNLAIGNNALKSNLTSSNSLAIGLNALENSTGGSNTAVGVNSLRANTTGSLNTALGNLALGNNLTGIRNTALGYNALEDNTVGYYNSGVGYSALARNTTGNYNTGVGYLAVNNNLTGDFNVGIGALALTSNRVDGNTAVGYNALNNNSYASANVAIGRDALATQSFHNSNVAFGTNNVAVGVAALFSNQPTNATNGSKNVAVGNYTLNSNTTGINNTAVGHEALNNNTSGIWNIGIGVQSLFFNTTGGSNISIGNNSMRENISGSDNVSIGVGSLYGNLTGDHNTAVGIGALNANTSGGYNTAVGSRAGSFNDANTYCTFLGYDADQTVATNFSASMALGYSSRITASNQIRIGHAGASSIGGYEAWSNLSDGRFKQNIKEDVKGLAFIMGLRPVTYTIDVPSLSTYLKEDIFRDKEGKIVQRPVDPTLLKLRSQQAQVVHTGFVAQEVEAVAKNLGYDFSGVDKPKNADDLYALRYSEFVVPLVKAVQEQQSEITDLKARIKRLEAMVEKLATKQNQ